MYIRIRAFPLSQIIGDRYVKQDVWINKIIGEEDKTYVYVCVCVCVCVCVAANHIERRIEFTACIRNMLCKRNSMFK